MIEDSSKDYNDNNKDISSDIKNEAPKASPKSPLKKGVLSVTIIVMAVVILAVGFLAIGGKDILRAYKLRMELFDKKAFASQALWTITQYGDSSGKQDSFYILTSNKGQVVVIDGGWKDNSEQVAYELKRRGGKVDAWILTHPHPDHIGAFNDIYKSGDIKIKAIYDNNLDIEYYDTVNESWDEIEIYKEYLEETTGDSNVHHIKVGDKVELEGISFTFYSAYDDSMQGLKDICNNSSLVFTADTGDYEILFVGDCYDENIIGSVLADHKDEVKPDMAQMPHHGNSILPDNYYEELELEICFFDAPAWLMEDVNYSTYLHQDAMERAGARCIDQSMAPTTVKLYLEED